MRSCANCSREVADDFRFCPHCGASQRSKLVEYFRGHRQVDGGDLRVSVYLTDPQHVRLSVWRDERAEAAMSLAPDEAHRLGEFLLTVTPRRESFRRRVEALLDLVAGR
jgi:hypothetical protein